MKRRSLACFIVPTGIGASIGGYAGDASLYAKKFAKYFDLIVNPNVVNAAVFSGITNNMLYTEGSVINKFFNAELSLKKSKNNKIGVIFDKKIPQNVLNIHINTINAMKTVYGFDIAETIITDEEVGVEYYITNSGISSGGIKNEKTLLKAGKALLNKGVDALAVVCHFDEPQEDNYSNGDDVDVVGGIEAIISHYLSNELKVPCVHAPAFSDYTITSELVHPKASSEYITPTFLPCLFFGLNNAPKIKKYDKDFLTVDDVKFLVMPYNSLGSPVVFSALEKNIPVFAIRENTTKLKIERDVILSKNGIIECIDYDECLMYTRKEFL